MQTEQKGAICERPASDSDEIAKLHSRARFDILVHSYAVAQDIYRGAQGTHTTEAHTTNTQKGKYNT